MALKKGKYSDSDLIRLFHDSGKREYAFNLIIKKYQDRLYWHIRKMVIVHEDTNDILQDTFLKAWNALYKFREDSSLFTWLYRIATNETLAFLKRKKRKYYLPIVDMQKQLAETLEDDVYFNGNEAQMKLQKAILELPERQRLVFNLKYFDELKYEEIAEILNTSVGSLKASYHHAVKKIEYYIKSD
ncbi:MAG: sigma-70 family RNA polymerase sigma factor [Bacteroidales bacterium]|nr:sigma-70 family RNA polymerase sigma factor [Bacteroidales bacterium]